MIMSCDVSYFEPLPCPKCGKNQDIQCGNTDTTAAKCTNWDVVEKLGLPAGTQKKKLKKNGI